jgi:AcrR family transcriptional regulator
MDAGPLRPSPGRSRRARASSSGARRSTRAAARQHTQERLLDAALVAVARHGLAKLAMADVSARAGVSRGTAYRYFPNVETLLLELGRREAARFERRVWEALERTPPGPERLKVVLEYAVRLARDHPLVERLPETDPGFVLVALRERFPGLLASFERLLAPLLEETTWVREGAVTAHTLANWTTRVLISSFLFPDPDPEAMAGSLEHVHRMLAGRRAG